MASWLSNNPSGSLCTLPGSNKPALLMTMSGTVFFKHQFPSSFACCLSDRSKAFALIETEGYLVCNSSIALYKATSLRLLKKISYLFAAKISAIAFPIPLDAPVINTVIILYY